MDILSGVWQKEGDYLCECYSFNKKRIFVEI